MFYKIKKATAVSKIGDYIDVHDDQKDYLIDNGIIESEGVEENPNAQKPAEFVGTPGVTTVAGIVVDPSKAGAEENPDKKEEKEKKGK